MPASSKDQPEEVQSDEPEDFFETLESDQQKSNELLAKFFLHSDRLFEAEEKLAENLSHQLKPFEAVYQRVQKHTAFRSAMFSLFLDPSDNEQLELFKYERDYENY